MIGVLSEAHAGRAPGAAEGEGRRTGGLGRGFRLLGRRSPPKAQEQNGAWCGLAARFFPGPFLSRFHHGAVLPPEVPHFRFPP